tara:strand:+ start:108 stop:293 length:186 start_codon:yes stop_codon:yes gene_type:complete
VAQVVTVVRVVVPLLVIIIQGMVFLDKVMTVVRRLMMGNRVAAVEQEKQETRIVKVTAVMV